MIKKILVCILSNYNSYYPQYLIDKITDDFHDCQNIDVIVMTDRKDYEGNNRTFYFSWKNLKSEYLLNQYSKVYIGNCVFPFLKLYNKYPSYDRYVFVEDDLLWTGDWNLLFDRMKVTSDYDVILPQKIKPSDDWYWDRCCNFYCDDLKVYSGMLQLYALSNRSIKWLDRKLKEKKCFGHHELLVNTLLINNDDFTKWYFNTDLTLQHIYTAEYKIIDDLNDGKFEPNTLYHPIKTIKTYKRFS